MEDNKLFKGCVYALGAVILVPIIWNTAVFGINAIAKLVAKGTFEAKMKKLEKEGSAMKIDGKWYKVEPQQDLNDEKINSIIKEIYAELDALENKLDEEV